MTRARGSPGMACRTGAGGAVFCRGPSELAMAISAEGVEGCLRRLPQVCSRRAVTVQTAADSGLIDEVVMAGHAVDRRVLFMWEVDGDYCWSRRGLEQV